MKKRVINISLIALFCLISGFGSAQMFPEASQIKPISRISDSWDLSIAPEIQVGRTHMGLVFNSPNLVDLSIKEADLWVWGASLTIKGRSPFSLAARFGSTIPTDIGI